MYCNVAFGGLSTSLGVDSGGPSTLMLLLIARTNFSDFSDQSHYR